MSLSNILRLAVVALCDCRSFLETAECYSPEDDDWDEDTDDAENRWIPAKRSQLTDSKVDKYYLDPFRTFSVYIYRCNKGRKPKNWMLNTRGYDFYSIGPDEQDDTVLGDEEEDEENESDDVSNS